MSICNRHYCEADERVEEAINRVLDLVERPVGTLKAHLPQTEQTEKALVALFDAVDRRM